MRVREQLLLQHWCPLATIKYSRVCVCSVACTRAIELLTPRPAAITLAVLKRARGYDKRECKPSRGTVHISLSKQR